jgi:hypothetical protein
VVVHTYDPSNGRKCKIEASHSRLAWAKNHDLLSRIDRAKKTGEMAQNVELVQQA